MGTTLTGTTPQDTYDSLIKVTDNGPISGTLKALSDGLGNDTTLSLSTTAASIAGTLAVAGNATFDTTTLVVDATNNRVGINKATPTTTLDVSGTFATTAGVTLASASGNVGIGTGTPSGKLHVFGGDIFLGASYALKFSSTSFITPENNVSGAEISTAGAFIVKAGATPAERLRVTDTGNVGININNPSTKLVVNRGLQTDTITIANAASYFYGADIGLAVGQAATVTFGTWLQSLSTSNVAFPLLLNPAGGNIGINKTNPIVQLDVAGDIRTSTGVLFGTDTAAANLLDDYEEGTFTPTSGGGITITTIYNATYTKIGNTVTFQIWLFASVTSANFVITGLPFTTSGRTACSLSSISLGQSISNQIVSTDIYGYGATLFVGNEMFIGGVYRVA